MSYQCDILIVDDESIVGERLKAFTKKHGHRVETFVEPSAVLKRLEEKDFDIVISDIRMGEIDGIQVMQKVFQKPPCARSSSPMRAPPSAPAPT